MLSDDELLRYSRHLLLPSLGVEAQQQWKNSRVCIIGCGGLGNPLGLYLAGAGVGRITLVDDDHVEASNLPRQVAFKTQDIGSSKALALQKNLLALNPEIEIQALTQKFTAATSVQLEHDSFDLIFDCTDHFASRYVINRWALATKTALVSAAALEFQGLCVLLNQHDQAPCYACLFPEDSQDRARDTCAESGVFSPVLGVMSSLQADIGLRYLACKAPVNLSPAAPSKSFLYQWDARRYSMRNSQLKRDPSCLECMTE